jgi:hypothetical protein
MSGGPGSGLDIVAEGMMLSNIRVPASNGLGAEVGFRLLERETQLSKLNQRAASRGAASASGSAAQGAKAAQFANGESCPAVYRGGSDMTPKPAFGEGRVDPKTGEIFRGVSTFSNPAKAAKYGPPHEVVSLPEGLKVKQIGRDPEHFEIISDRPMSFQEYAERLREAVLRPFKP